MVERPPKKTKDSSGVNQRARRFSPLARRAEADTSTPCCHPDVLQATQMRALPAVRQPSSRPQGLQSTAPSTRVRNLIDLALSASMKEADRSSRSKRIGPPR